MTNTRKEISYIVRVALLSALATVLMIFEFPLPFIAPPFYEMDFSEIPVLIGTFAMGPIAGVVIELIKILMNLAINGTVTAGIGELANFVMGCAFIIPAGLIYEYKKTKKNALIGMLVSTLSMAVVALFINAFVMIPIYGKLLGISSAEFIGMGNAIIPAVNSIFDLALFCVVPFNLIKGLGVSLVTFFIYKPIHPLLKKISF